MDQNSSVYRECSEGEMVSGNLAFCESPNDDNIRWGPTSFYYPQYGPPVEYEETQDPMRPGSFLRISRTMPEEESEWLQNERKRFLKKLNGVQPKECCLFPGFQNAIQTIGDKLYAFSSEVLRNPKRQSVEEKLDGSGQQEGANIHFDGQMRTRNATHANAG